MISPSLSWLELSVLHMLYSHVDKKKSKLKRDKQASNALWRKAMRACKTCGKEDLKSVKFCTSCGSPMQEAGSLVTPVNAPKPGPAEIPAPTPPEAGPVGRSRKATVIDFIKSSTERLPTRKEKGAAEPKPDVVRTFCNHVFFVIEIFRLSDQRCGEIPIKQDSFKNVVCFLALWPKCESLLSQVMLGQIGPPVGSYYKEIRYTTSRIAE